MRIGIALSPTHLRKALKSTSAKFRQRSSPRTSSDILLSDLGDDGILRLTLNDVKRRNALSEAMLGALGASFDAAGKDPAVRVIILAANGPAFCAGHDLKDTSDPCRRPMQTDRHGHPPIGVSSCPVGEIGSGVWCLRRPALARSSIGTQPLIQKGDPQAAPCLLKV